MCGSSVVALGGFVEIKVEHLAKLSCGHIEPFVLSPIVGWYEWCSICKDFRHVIDGV